MFTIGTPSLWIAFSVFVLIALLVDFFALSRQGAHKVSMWEAAIWSIIWLIVPLIFVAGLWWYLNGHDGNVIAHNKAMDFISGYLVERALAVDNIFVFILLFSYFGVAPEYQKSALMIGILVALVLRAVLIVLGAWLISQFHWILYGFGAFLVYTGFKMARGESEETDISQNPLLKFIRKHLTVSPDYDGQKIFTRINGVRMATPMLVVIIAIGIIDVVFAVDSIPAIFAITTDSFVVLTSNVFAILGLRALYFLLAGMQEKFHLLAYGLAVVLIFIGVKMLLMDIFPISTAVSLCFTVITLVVAMTLSILIPPKHVEKES